MFVRRRRDVAEQYFQSDLKALGYFINERDEVRKIANPTEKFEYKVFRSQRLNELRREAFVACFRQIALERLERLGLRTFKLSQPNHHAHIPILHTPDLAHNTSKLLILFPDDNVDLGIWSIRSIDGENGTIRTGTMESIVSHAISKGYSVIIANSGALLFDPDFNTTVTSVSFNGRQKSWTLGGRIRNFDPTWNVVKGSEDPTAHVTTIFETFVSKVVPASTKIFILAAGAGAGSVVQYFDRTFFSWSSRLGGFAFAEPTYSITALSSSSFKQFLNKLARAYIVHDETMGTQVADLRFGCSTFSAETLYQECIVPICETEIMEYLELARQDPEWCNPSMVFEDLTVDGENGEGVQEAMDRIRLQQQQQGQGVYTGHTWGDGSTPGCGW